MVELSNRVEVAVVAVIATIGLTAVYLSQQPIPDGVKLPVVTVLGLIAFVWGTFWALYVKAETAGDVPLPPQVQGVQPASVVPVKSAAKRASSDKQAKTKG